MSKVVYDRAGNPHVLPERPSPASTRGTHPAPPVSASGTGPDDDNADNPHDDAEAASAKNRRERRRAQRARKKLGHESLTEKEKQDRRGKRLVLARHLHRSRHDVAPNSE